MPAQIVMDNGPTVRERIWIDVEDMLLFLNELHREVQQGKVEDAMRSIRQQMAIVRGKPKPDEGAGPS
jgi:hypothetical protein